MALVAGPIRVPPLATVNHEPDGHSIGGVIRLLNVLLAPLTRRDWQGQDRIPREGGVVLVANHISNADPLALGQYVAYSGRWPRFMAKRSLFTVPGLGAMLRRVGQIPVDRSSGQGGDSLAAAAVALRAGRAVVVYPEGTITREPNLWPMRGRTGAARLALDTGAPVVPIGQWGAEQIMYGPRLGLPHLLRRPTLQLTAGPAVDLDDLREEPVTRPVLHEATERIMVAITDLVAELRGAHPPEVRFDPRIEGPAGPRGAGT